MKKIAFIIVNYRSREYLRGCLASVFENLGDFYFEVIIVNNDEERLDDFERENIKIIEINQNIGFGASSNRGAKEAEAEILCFLNPDTEILSKNIEDLIGEFEKDKKIEIVGPKVVDERGYVQKWSAGREINLKEIIKSNLGFPDSKKVWGGDKKIEADWVTGAAMFIKKETFEKLGGFDEKFFLYFEDIDLCKRVRERGDKIIYFPDFQVKHLGGKSNRNKKEQKKEYYKSQDYYFEKWFGKKTKSLIRFLRKLHW